MGNSFSDERKSYENEIIDDAEHENQEKRREKRDEKEERKKEKKTPKKRFRKNKSVKNKIKYFDN